MPSPFWTLGSSCGGFGDAGCCDGCGDQGDGSGISDKEISRHMMTPLIDP